MALVKCKECGKEVSKKAKTCPGCGHPVSSKKRLLGCSGKIWLLAILTIFAFIVIGQRGYDTNNTAVSTSQQTPPESADYAVDGPVAYGSPAVGRAGNKYWIYIPGNQTNESVQSVVNAELAKARGEKVIYDNGQSYPADEITFLVMNSTKQEGTSGGADVIFEYTPAGGLKKTSGGIAPQAPAVDDELRNKIVDIYKSDTEPTVKDAIWTASDVFKVGVVDDGNSRDGFAQYICEDLNSKGFSGVKVWVQVIDIAKLVQNSEWVKLGEAHCND